MYKQKPSPNKRARQDSQKFERRNLILEEARHLFLKGSYESISMAALSKKSGLAKGTLYLYFKSKEELFLALYETHLEKWFGEVNAELEKMIHKKPADLNVIHLVVKLMVRSMKAHQDLARLLIILHTILEQNIKISRAIEFKLKLAKHLTRTGSLLETALKFPSSGEGAMLLLRANALIIGLWQMANPGPVVREALEHPEIRGMKFDFFEEFSQTYSALLSGLELNKTNAKRSYQS